ncbi:hypothetical protein FB451DRAFT_243000 [Mycena latifolia]|nr:hypothetical protein FB451DRAFT_243000 [Mycena latifolia]
MSKLFYTWSTGTDMVFSEHSHYFKTREHHLYLSGERILAEHEFLLTQLWHEGARPCDIRLQSALAAAVQDITPQKFRTMSTDELADLRSRCDVNRLFNSYTAPPLVVFLGRPLSTATINPSPSTFGTITYETRENVQAKSLVDEDINGASWAEEWDATEGPWPSPWGWHVQGVDQRSWYLFLSGAYVAWPHRWSMIEERGSQGEIKKLKASIQARRLETHLKATLFHELTHHSWVAVHGRSHPAPGKIVANHERGQLAQRLAFGGVVDLVFTKDAHVKLFATDESAPRGDSDYWLDDRLVPLLFTDVGSPIDFGRLASAQRLITVPEYARSKASEVQCGQLANVPPKNDLPTESSSSANAPPSHSSSGLKLITGELADAINRNRANTIWMKSSCVQMG